MRKGCAILLLLAELCGCTRVARFYPANEPAAATGLLQAEFTPYGWWHSDVTIPLPDGEVLRGQAGAIPSGAAAFGNLLGAVYGPVDTPYGPLMPSALTLPEGFLGMANLFGSQGTTLYCEYVTNPHSGRGYGACQSSKGGLYRMQY